VFTVNCYRTFGVVREHKCYTERTAGTSSTIIIVVVIVYIKKYIESVRLDACTLNNFSNWSLNIKWNSFRMITLINKKCVEHRSIVYYESVN